MSVEQDERISTRLKTWLLHQWHSGADLPETVLRYGVHLPAEAHLQQDWFSQDALQTTPVDLNLVFDPEKNHYVSNTPIIWDGEEKKDFSMAPDTLLIALGRTQEAVRYMQGVIKDQGDYFQAWNRLSMAHERNGDQEAAVETLNKAIELAPEEPRYAALYRNKFLTLSNMGRHEEALEALDQYMDKAEHIIPNDFYLKGRALEALGREEEAGQQYEIALIGDSSSPKDRHQYNIWRQKVAQDLGYDSVQEALEGIAGEEGQIKQEPFTPSSFIRPKF